MLDPSATAWGATRARVDARCGTVVAHDVKGVSSKHLLERVTTALRAANFAFFGPGSLDGEFVFAVFAQEHISWHAFWIPSQIYMAARGTYFPSNGLHPHFILMKFVTAINEMSP